MSGTSFFKAPVYKKSSSSLIAFIRSGNTSVDLDPERVVAEWLISLLVSGHTYKTALSYFNAISGIFARAIRHGCNLGPGSFDVLRARLKAEGEGLWQSAPDIKSMSRFQTLLHSASVRPDAVLDIVRLSMLNGAMPLAAVVALRNSDLGNMSQECCEIAVRHQDPRRRYIFNLAQSRLTPRQLGKYANSLVGSFMIKNSLPMTGTADETLSAYWALAALKCGISAGDVNAVIGREIPGIKILTLLPPSEISEKEKAGIKAEVARLFVACPEKWHVMKLRTRTKFEDITRRFGLMGDRLKCPQMFYPCEEIMKRVGRRLVSVTKPVIPDIVFFKCRESDIYPIFSVIGDLAWCYTVSGKPGDAYASVPDTAFEIFQKTIGQFTPEYQVAPLGAIPLKVNDRVVVVGGLFEGEKGRVDKIETGASDGSTVYRLFITKDNGIEWRVTLDRRFLRRE